MQYETDEDNFYSLNDNQIEFMKKINNCNLKELMKKKYLTEELVREIKTSFFIHPSTIEDDNLYSFNHNYYDDRKVIELFTSLDEYYQIYGDNDDYIPLFWYFNQFEGYLTEDTKGILINPTGDDFFIPEWVCFFIMDDMNDVKRNIELNNVEVDVDNLKKLESKSSYLNKYLANKSKITYIKNLFDILGSSVLYVLYEFEESFEEYFENDMVLNEKVKSRFYKKDNYIVVFIDKKDFKSEMDSKLYYTYGICDLIYIIQTIFELDYNGFILKTHDNEFILARHRLLKYWEDIVENYRHIDIANKYSFRIEGEIK